MAGAWGRLVRGEANFNIIGRARYWLLASGIVLLASLGGLFGRGLNLSIDFKGGTVFQVPIASSAHVTVQQANNALSSFNVGEVRSQIETDPTTHESILRVETEKSACSAAQQSGAQCTQLSAIEAGLARLTGQPNQNSVSVNDVGPTWGSQISSKALRGLIVFLILVTIYISFRFEPKMAVGALLALFHDLLATAGIYALIGIPVTPATVVALLTLLGYSLYDTVVVFDKVQDNVTNVSSKSALPYSEMVNRSVNQVMMRSINTSLSTLLPIAALLFVGVMIFHAATLEDLAVALFIGTIVGTYSSIFIASPILAFLKEREPKYQNIRRRIEAEARGEKPSRRATAQQAEPEPAAVAVAERDDEDAGGERAGSGARAPIRVNRPPAKPRKKKKKKRR